MPLEPPLQQLTSSQQQPMVGPALPPLWQRQLQHYEAWACSLGQRALVQAVPLASVLSALRIVVHGFPEATTAEELETLFNDLMAAHGAAVAPGCAVTSCALQPDATAVLQLRCAIEASNCLAFDGMLLKDSVLKVSRPQDYIPEAAVLLGPTEPNPAVRAAVASTAAAPSPAACGDACAHDGAAAAGGSSCTFAAAVRSERAAAGAAAVRGASCGAGSKAGGSRGDLLLPGAAPDQSKQDEVFIGGLPSHWKAQQLKELLAPFGPLKSLSVAMDAATGKNKGYAFVVFACSDMVSHAIEQLDCRVVEGKILAVQRATEGKATCGRESSTGGNDIGVLRDGGMGGAAPPLSGSGGSGGNLQHLHGGHAGLRDQQQHAHQQQPQHAPLPHGPPLMPNRGMHHHRSSSTGSGLSLPPHILPSDHSLTAASTLSSSSAGGGGSGLFGSGGSASSGGGSATTGHTRSHSGGGHGLPSMAAFAAAAAGGGGSAGPLPPPTAAAAAGDGSTLGGPRVPTGPPPPGGSVLLHSSGPSSTKQYDVNELYIGDLPLTWDEDAVRRLLGRFGRIKYFTLRNGRDKNFAFCKFKDSSVVDAAISGLHGKIVDGYFLNVRRAVEGKQQAAAAAAAAAQQQQWLGGSKQHPPPQQQQHFQQQQQHGAARASFDAASSVAGGRPGPGGAGLHPHAHHVRSISSDQHAHFSRSVPSAAGLLYGMPGGGGRAGASPRVPGVAAGAGAAAAAPAGEREQQQAHTEATSANSAPSTPGTPTAGLEQPEPAFGAAAAAGPPLLPPHPGPFGPPSGPPPLRPAQAAAAGAAYLHQQQQLLLAQQQLQLQQQAASYGAAAAGLFNGPLPPPMPPAGAPASLFGPQCPASWPGTAALQAPAAGSGLAGGGFGGGALGGAAGGGKQEAVAHAGGGGGASSQAQRQSLLQTWDMLSPWSLFSSSNPAQ